MLRYDHAERVTCQEAMAHPYFDPVRKGWPGDGAGGATAPNGTA